MRDFCDLVLLWGRRRRCLDDDHTPKAFSELSFDMVDEC